tara:strand:- start:4462 stop:4695 length:234 start_codon:yes stop_codon:yes gene_type:complete
MAIKYKLKEGKTLEDIPKPGNIGKYISACLKDKGFYVADAQGIPGKCLPFLEEIKETKASDTSVKPVSSNKKVKGGK